MLVAEEPSGAPHAGLDLVQDQQCAEAPAQGLGLAPVGLGRQVDALALDGLDHQRGHVAPGQLALERVGVAEGDRVAPGQERSEPLPELLAPVERQGAVGEAVEGVVAVEDRGCGRWRTRANLMAASTVSAPELAKTARRMPGCARSTSARPSRPGSSAQSSWARFGQVGVERLAERVLDHRVAAAEGEHAEPGQEVERASALVVDQVGALAPDVGAVEPEGGQHLGQLGVEVPRRAGRTPHPGGRPAVRRGRRTRSRSGRVGSGPRVPGP